MTRDELRELFADAFVAAAEEIWRLDLGRACRSDEVSRIRASSLKAIDEYPAPFESIAKVAENATDEDVRAVVFEWALESAKERLAPLRPS